MMLPNPEQLTRKLIEEWARDNPTIKSCLVFHLKYGLSYEQALIAMVHFLASQNKELNNEKIEGFLKQPLTIQVSQGEYNHYKSILNEGSQQSPWGQVMSDIAVNELREEEEE